jgi:hypothetical protein
MCGWEGVQAGPGKRLLISAGSKPVQTRRLEMNRTIRIAALATMTLVGIAQAHAGVSTLAECYDLVIADCNKGDHAQSCASSGMDQCDKVFPTPMVLQPGLVFGIGTAPREPVASNNLKQMGIATHR